MSSATRVSTTSTDQQANGDSSFNEDGNFTVAGANAAGVFLPDGSSILFETDAQNIVGTYGEAVVLKNLVTGQDTVELSGVGGDSGATLSADGGTIVYQGFGSNGSPGILEKNLSTGQTTLVSNNGAGTTSNPYGTIIGVSSDGTRVAFQNTRNFSLSGITDYVKDVTSGKLVQFGDNSGYSSPVEVTPNLQEGLYVDYALSPGGTTQLYAENLTTGATSLVATDPSGNPGNQSTSSGQLTPDGKQVIFGSGATNLLPSAPAGGIFAKNLSTQATNLIVADQQTATAPNSTVGVEHDLDDLSADGTKIVYSADTYTQNTASSGSTSGTDSVHLEIKDLGTGSVVNASPVFNDNYSNDPPTATVQTSVNNGSNIGQAIFSPDGTKIAYVVRTINNETSTFNNSTDTATSSGSVSYQVSVFNAATGSTTTLPNVSSNASPIFYGLSFSPNSQELAYSASASDVTSTQTIIADLATGTQTVLPTNDGPFAFSPDGSSVAYTSTSSTLVPGDTNNASDVFIQPLCFVTGTLIRTARGDVAVEALVVGDRAVTASGATRPIVWIGHRHLDCAALPVPSEAWPVRVRAGAFGVGSCGDSLPARDLRLSPGHPVLVDDGAGEGDEGGVLVPIMCLINGTSIARVPVERVTYWHVELDAHDILLADGLPAESYLDLGGRGWFAGGEGSDDRLTDPDLVAPAAPGRCRAVAVDGPVVARERLRLDALFAAGLAAHCRWSGTGLDGSGPWPGTEEGSPAS